MLVPFGPKCPNPQLLVTTILLVPLSSDFLVLTYKYLYWIWRRKWQPTLVFLLGEFHGQRILVGCSPWSHKESDTTEHSTHTPILNIGLHLSFSVWIISLRKTPLWSIHVSEMTGYPSFSWMNNIPLYTYIHICCLVASVVSNFVRLYGLLLLLLSRFSRIQLCETP